MSGSRAEGSLHFGQESGAVVEAELDSRIGQ